MIILILSNVLKKSEEKVVAHVWKFCLKYERLMREAREDVFEIMDAINNGADTLEALEELGYKKDVAKAV